MQIKNADCSRNGIELEVFMQICDYLFLFSWIKCEQSLLLQISPDHTTLKRMREQPPFKRTKLHSLYVLTVVLVFLLCDSMLHKFSLSNVSLCLKWGGRKAYISCPELTHFWWISNGVTSKYLTTIGCLKLECRENFILRTDYYFVSWQDDWLWWRSEWQTTNNGESAHS